MDPTPRTPNLDSTFDILREGYPFILRRCRRYGADLFLTRFMGQQAVCIHGPEAAEVFYDGDRFQRAGALPRRIQKTLMGEHGVQTLDDAAHHQRKAIFLSLMRPERIAALARHVEVLWQRAQVRWEQEERVVLFPEVQDLLCQAACAWAGVPLAETDVHRRADEFDAMIDAFGAIGPLHWRGRLARRSAEAWIGGLIRDVRGGDLHPDPESALAVFATHRELDGALLAEKTAAVEVINVIRPIVAIATYVTFAALALHEHPRCRQALLGGDEGEVLRFVQEVRRYYPFAPFVGARVRKDFVWRGHAFRRGTLVLLDIYGTNRDARVWEQPDEFMPERFLRWGGSPFDFIPQGGGFHSSGHRCAGEWITIEVLKVATRQLCQRMEYDVPAQDLRYSLARMPTIPRSRFVIRRVRAAAEREVEAARAGA